MCSIPVAPPCVGCSTRGRECTFDMAPTTRKRRRTSPPLSIPVPPPSLPAPAPRAEPAASPSTNTQRPPPTEDPTSLEDEADDADSHFVGTGVFSSLILPSSRVSSAFVREGSLAFRQVSTDEQHPAYFIKHPSFLYGRAPSSGLDAFGTACALVPEGTAERAVEALVRITLPAFPFIDAERLVASTRTSPRYALLTGIMAHCTSYLPDIAPVRKELWAQALLGLEDEYRQPRLRTLQLAILVLCSRPSENAGQCEIGLGRVGFAEEPCSRSRRRGPLSCSGSTSIRHLGHCQTGRKASGGGSGGVWSCTISGARSCMVGHVSEFPVLEATDIRTARESHNVRIPEIEGDSRDARLSMTGFVAECHLTEIVE